MSDLLRLVRTHPARRAWRVIVAGLALLVLFAVRVPPAHAQRSAGRGSLLIAQGHRLSVRNLATGEEHAILTLPNEEFARFPVWLPNGAGILYVDQRIYSGDANSDWGSDIVQADADGGNPHVLLVHDARGADIDGLAVTPDGNSVLFGYTRTDLSPDLQLLGQVIRMNRLDFANGRVTLLADGAVDPGVSADGRTVAYVDVSNPDGSPRLWVANSDGSEPRVALIAGPNLLALFAPRFSPDGRTILFVAAPDPTRGPRGARLDPAPTYTADGPPQDAWTVGVDGSHLLRITRLLEDQPSASWSGDGRQVAVAGQTGIYLVNADGTGVNRLGDGYLHCQVAWLEQ